MPFTYDVTTALGQTRLLCQDFDPANAIFQDLEIQTFLNLNSQDVRMAAAQALDVIASNEAFVSKKLIIDGDSFDGTAVANALRAQASELRRQVREGDADGLGLFDWSEEVVNPFTLRERLLADLLRRST